LFLQQKVERMISTWSYVRPIVQLRNHFDRKHGFCDYAANATLGQVRRSRNGFQDYLRRHPKFIFERMKPLPFAKPLENLLTIIVACRN